MIAYAAMPYRLQSSLEEQLTLCSEERQAILENVKKGKPNFYSGRKKQGMEQHLIKAFARTGYCHR